MEYNYQAFNFEADAQEFLSEMTEQSGHGYVEEKGNMFVVYWKN